MMERESEVTMSMEKRFTVIGAGHGGKAMAADLAARGFTVTLYNRTPARIADITLRPDIELEREDGMICTGHLEHATSNITEALDGADVIMVVVPAPGHRFIAQVCAPHLVDGQVIVLNPGRTGGALEFCRIVRSAGCTKDIFIAEACSFIFASRSTGPAQARIFRRKNTVPLAALPATKTRDVLDAVRVAYPQFIPAANVLYTSLDNIGAVLHPALALLNAGWIESTKGEFQFYIDGATRSVAHVLEMIDYERMAVQPRAPRVARRSVRC
jgi:opine dehydrogenase